MKIPTFVLLINAQASICKNADVDNNKSTLSIYIITDTYHLINKSKEF